jgi:hypothetical protein
MMELMDIIDPIQKEKLERMLTAASQKQTSLEEF